MERLIKFRGKRTDTGELVFGDLIHGVGSKHGRMYILPVTHIYPKGCNDLDGWEVIPETVGQFTGLLDKNGKEIYEGDILRNSIVVYHSHYFQMDDMSSVNCLCGTVEYKSLGFQCIYRSGKKSRSVSFKDAEIIGNIHDNPELLKGGEE